MEYIQFLSLEHLERENYRSYFSFQAQLMPMICFQNMHTTLQCSNLLFRLETLLFNSHAF